VRGFIDSEFGGVWCVNNTLCGQEYGERDQVGLSRCGVWCGVGAMWCVSENSFKKLSQDLFLKRFGHITRKSYS
jgi:hypothetical protein